MQILTFAGIDIGSYEVGMKIFELSAKNGMKEITYIRHRIELGKDAYNTGKISAQRMNELCGVLAGFVDIMREYQVDAYRACVTSAIREADNGLLVLENVRVRTGIDVEALSNSEQRFLGYKSIAYQGKQFEEMIRKGTAIFDVGGGSIQLSLFDKDKLVTTQNIRMGILRIRERIAAIEDRPERQAELVEELVDSEIASFRKLYLKDRDIKSVIFVGDYINYIVKTFKKDGSLVVAREELLAQLEAYSRMKPEETARKLGIPADNASLILPSMIIYKRLVEMTNAEVIWAPGRNLSDGLAYDYGERNKLIKTSHNFENDILAAAKNISKRYLSDKAHINQVDGLGLQILDAIRKVSGLGPRDRLLFSIAVQLHQCGKYITVSKAAECNYDIVMATEIIGLSHKERNLVANIVRYTTEEFPTYEKLAATEEIEEDTYLRIMKLTAVFRAANALDRSHRQKIKNMKAVLKDYKLQLNISDNVDLTLEKDALDDKGDFFEYVFGIRPVIRQKKKF